MLVELIPSLASGFFKDTIDILETYLYIEEQPLLKRITHHEISRPASADSESLRENILELTISHLKTLYQVSSTSTLSASSDLTSLQKLLLICHSSRNPDIAKFSSKTMGSIVKSFQKLDPILFDLWWECIATCLTNPDSGVDPENGYILWLRCISGNVLNGSSDKLQHLFDTDSYWGYLQDGVLNKTYEIRKYTLYILSQSLQKIDHDLDFDFMTWKVSEKDTYTFEWQRYTTLVNIISIDTSLHQAEDSSFDLIKIIGQESLIPKSWARCLLSAGLQSSMDSLKKYIGNVAMQVTTKDMEIYATGFSFLTDILLPHLMTASLFTVEKSKGTPSIDICPYGEQLSNFIASLFQYLDDNTSRAACNHLLSFLYGLRLSFDPARLYVMYGIERGLKDRRVLTLAELDLVKSLFSSTAETKLREKAIYFLYFRLLLSTSDEIVPFKSWFSVLADITSNQPYLYLESAAEVVTFIKSTKYIDEFEALHADILEEKSYELLPVYIDLSFSLGSQPDQSDLENLSFSQLLEYSRSGIPSALNFFQESSDLQKRFQKDLTFSMLNNDSIESAKFLEISASFKELPESQKDLFKFSEVIPDYTEFIASLWSPLYNLDVIDNAKLEYVYSQISMINIILEQPDYSFGPSAISAEQLIEFLNKLVIAKTPSKASNVVKNNALSESYRALYNVLSFSNVDAVLLLDTFASQVESVTSQCRYQICRTVLDLIKGNASLVARHTKTFTLLVRAFWASLVTDRLIATERSLHTSFIDLAFNQDVLKVAVDDSELAGALETIAEELIQLCYARRGLLSKLSEIIYDYHKSHPVSYSKWIGRISVSIFTFAQINDNLFRLEHVIGALHDQLSIDRHDININPAIYAEEYGRIEVSSRIDIILSFASLKASVPSDVEYANYLFDFILNSPRYHIFEPVKRNDGLEELERVCLYQVLLVLSRFLERDLQKLDVLTTETFIPSLYTEPSPVVRTSIEWLISRFTFRLLQSGFTSSLFDKISNFEESPRILASYQKICLMVARRMRSANIDSWAQYYYDYILKVIPFASSNRAGIRHFAVSMLCALSNEFNDFNDDQNPVPSMLKDLLLAVEGVTKHAQNSENYKQYRSGDDSVWDIERDFTVVGICGGVLRKVSDRVFGDIDQLDFALFIRDENNLEIPMGLDIDHRYWIPENMSISEAESTLISSKPASESTPLQVKSVSWNSVYDMTVGEDGRDSDKIKRGELIVVSSLVDKAPNLGGICRLCDVLGAKQLCLDDISITRHPQFKNVAVSADRWMPMIEVKQADIIDFMLQKKREGYTLIGLEQTDKSVELNADLKFPRKSLVLLGKEREGIPGEYLAELDFCVEIKQVGVIRSMNIQTATAVLVHSYSVQHC